MTVAERMPVVTAGHKTPDVAEEAAPPPPSPLLTYEAFLDWLDEDKHAEWVEGKIVMHSPVSLRHQLSGGFLLGLISQWVETHDLGVVAYAPFQMKIGTDLPGRAPDILFVAKKNLSRLKPNHLEGPADLVVEIISPESRGRDRGDKHYEYEKGGVGEYWLLDPERWQPEFYRPGADGIYTLVPLDEQGVFHSAALPDLYLRAAWLWQEPLPPVLDVLKEWGIVITHPSPGQELFVVIVNLPPSGKASHFTSACSGTTNATEKDLPAALR